MKNKELAEIFKNIADMLEINDENKFRVHAYRRAAQSLEGLSQDVADYGKTHSFDEIPGIGKDLKEKIQEYVKSGKIGFYEKLLEGVPRPILDFMKIPGVGPKTASMIYRKLKIKNLDDLQFKAKSGKIKNIDGIKEKTIKNILRGINFLKKSEGLTPINIAMDNAKSIVGLLKKNTKISSIEYAGSLRRMKEKVRDIDVVACSDNSNKTMEYFTSMPVCTNVLVKGKTKSSIMTTSGMQVDLRVVNSQSYGAALSYLTGSKEHNVRLREIAVTKGLKINEYGVFKAGTNKQIAGITEKSIYDVLGMSFVPPEMRENRGEVELALKNKLPKLVTLNDIKSDLHMHTEESDGVLSLSEIVDICQQKGYKYIAITDHSQILKIAGGLSAKRLFGQIKKIEKINKKNKKIKLLKGCEVDVLSDGKLDFGNEVLKELDFAIASIHSGFTQSKDKLTSRIMKAMDNKHINMIGHPTGRLAGVRQGYEIDIMKILRHAKDTNTSIEINCHPDRLDLNDVNVKLAKEMGVSIGLATDSHTKEQFDNIYYGLGVARRGWLEKKDILNSLSLKEFFKRIKK